MNPLVQRHCHLDVQPEAVVSRRDVLRMLAAGGLGAATVSWRDQLSLQAAELRRQNRACILLWMHGGPSQLETFDPKPGHANGGETKAIATNVPGLQISENLPKLAGMADKLAIIRSLSIREGEHGLANLLMHTSRLPQADVQLPSLGTVAAHELAEAACELPAFVRIGENWRVGASGGYLGGQYDPFIIPKAGQLPENVKATVEAERVRRRIDLTQMLQESSVVTPIAASQDHRQLYQSAARMVLSPQMQAFDLEQEPATARDGYGRTPFGSACLLARRLVESGVTFVEINLADWDTHDNNFVRSRTLCGQFDQPMAHLLSDLGQRGLLDQTLVIWMGEFGRTPKINPRTGRDHFPQAFSAVLAGGGIRGGQAIGETDAGGETVMDRPVSAADYFQSIYRALRINPSREHTTSVGRPVKYVDGGESIPELF